MQTQEHIEQLLERELDGLCASRESADHGLYPRTAGTIIRRPTLDDVKYTSTGLCMNCAKANSCHLPGRKVGVWHCEEYL